MAYLDLSRITSWHAHVYFDAGSRDAARKFRDAVTAQFGNSIEMGRFHEREVGPHPRWSYQIAFVPSQFSDVVGGFAFIPESSMSLCIPIPTMNCAITATVRFGSGVAINWI